MVCCKKHYRKEQFIMSRKATQTEPAAERDPNIIRYNPTPRAGLTSAQAAERQRQGWANLPVESPSKSIKY